MTHDFQRHMQMNPTTRRRARAQAGFYQVEILVGLMILLIVMGIVAGYYRFNLKATKKSDDFYVSTQIASAALEDAKGDISNKDTLAVLLARIADSSHTRRSTVTKQGKPYTVTLRYRQVAAGANLLRIKATVNWDLTRGTSLGTVYPYEP